MVDFAEETVQIQLNVIDSRNNTLTMDHLQIPLAWLKNFAKGTENYYTNDTSQTWGKDIKECSLFRRLWATHLEDPRLTSADGEAIRSIWSDFPTADPGAMDHSKAHEPTQTLFDALRVQNWAEQSNYCIIILTYFG